MKSFLRFLKAVAIGAVVSGCVLVVATIAYLGEYAPLAFMVCAIASVISIPTALFGGLVHWLPARMRKTQPNRWLTAIAAALLTAGAMSVPYFTSPPPRYYDNTQAMADFLYVVVLVFVTIVAAIYGSGVGQRQTRNP